MPWLIEILIQKYSADWRYFPLPEAFELNVLLTYQTGFYVYCSNAGVKGSALCWITCTDVLNRVARPGDQQTYPRVVYGDNISNGSSFCDCRQQRFQRWLCKIKYPHSAPMPDNVTSFYPFAGALKYMLSGTKPCTDYKVPGRIRKFLPMVITLPVRVLTVTRWSNGRNTDSGS